MSTPHDLIDTDPGETEEWLDAFLSVLEYQGVDRARYLLTRVIQQAREHAVSLPLHAATPYCNTIPAQQEIKFSGDEDLEKRVTNLVRWYAVIMVLRAGKKFPELGGHIATYASAATLYEVGFNHFFHAASGSHAGDLIYIQGHSSPGIYARAFLEGRLNKKQLDHFRQEIGVEGLSSYPHPWLMPKFWQFATVSMGLGPLQAIYQARFLKYLQSRELLRTEDRKVWVFCGDGEMDEPESLGALTVAGREQLDNLIFVVNANLQRLDGPVRGNAKIIQELESLFLGANWHVIKVIWGRDWDALLAQDQSGLLQRRMLEVIDGEYQAYITKGGAYIREHFFGKYPQLQAMVADLSDETLENLMQGGGHDIRKVYAAYAAAVQHKNQPTLVIAKTVKGYGMGVAGEGQNTTHQQKKMNEEELKQFRTRFDLPMTDEDVNQLAIKNIDKNSPEIKYLQERRASLGGYLPQRRTRADEPLQAPDLAEFGAQLQSSGDRQISTTMVFVRLLHALLKNKNMAPRIVPIIPDESRTFGIEGLFRQIGIYSPVGQLYPAVDADQVMCYREDKKGQILEEGINEAGAFCSWMAAATSYSTNNFITVPFYIYYSMFGYQRVGDLVWAAGDMQARGFILGATAGRTTLAGEGLQHQDGHNLLFFSVVPNCVTYDPAFSYELAVIVQDGLRRMMQEQENVFYYITLMNENYTHPEMPENAQAGIIQGMYLLKAGKPSDQRVQLLGSGTVLREVMAAADLLEKDFSISADVWSVTSFTELRKEALTVERYNRLHPTSQPKVSYVTDCLKNQTGPVIAATDYIRLHADQIRDFIPQRYEVLGTDGYGRSDTREQLRHFFEVNRYYIAITALKALADEEKLPSSIVLKAIKKYKIDPEKPEPMSV